MEVNALSIVMSLAALCFGYVLAACRMDAIWKRHAVMHRAGTFQEGPDGFPEFVWNDEFDDETDCNSQL